MTRPKYQTRAITLTEATRAIAVAMVSNAPLGVEIVAREVVNARKPDQNSLMWAGPMNDIANQAWVGGKNYQAEVWHEQFKREYLPEIGCEDFEKHVKNPETYQKWAYTPGGDRFCKGSTTDLTVWGFGQYLEQVYAFGASLGVHFSANPRFAL
jgi:hypothetical protein